MVDYSKDIQTRDGLPARLLADNIKNERPVFAAVMVSPGKEVVHAYALDGKYWYNKSNNGFDLINVPPPKYSVWVSVYPDRHRFFHSKADADAYSSIDPIACFEVTYEVPPDCLSKKEPNDEKSEDA